MLFLLKVFVSYLYSVVSYLYISCNGPTTSVRKEIANLSAIVFL